MVLFFLVLHVYGLVYERKYKLVYIEFLHMLVYIDIGVGLDHKMKGMYVPSTKMSPHQKNPLLQVF